MDNKIAGSDLKFDYGIERILDGGSLHSGLPLGDEIVPAELAACPQLDRLLRLPQLDDYLEAQLVPKLSEANLMLPGKFRQTVDACLHTVRLSAEKQPPALARILNRAARLLAEGERLQQLLSMYRKALQRG